jgi:hypothetical protein
VRGIAHALAHALGEVFGLMVAVRLFWWIVIPAFAIGAGITAALGYGVFLFLGAVG